MKRTLRGALVGVGAFILASVLWIFGTMDSFEWSTYDARARSLARPGPNTERVVTVLVDQESLDWAAQTIQVVFPWPREVLSYIVDFIGSGNPKAMAFDVLYTEPSEYGFSDDIFAESIANFGSFVAAVHLEGEAGDSGAAQWPESSKRSVPVDGVDRWISTRWGSGVAFPDASFPIPQVASAAEYLGNVSAIPDADGVYRAVPAFGIYDGSVVPSIALATYLAGTDDEVSISVRNNRITIDDKTFTLDSGGRLIPRFRGPSQTHEAIRASAILRSQIQILEGSEPEVDPSIFDGAYVLFGYSAQGLKDLRPAPVDERFPGVEIHATILDNLLTGDFITPFSTHASLVLVFVLSLSSALAITLAKKVTWQIASFLLFGLIPIGLGYAGYGAGYWVPLVLAETGSLLALIGGTAANYFTEGKQKRFLKTAFQFYLSPEVIEEIIDDPDQLKLGGRRQPLTIFFSDLQGFTTITESLQERTPDLINEYLTPMANIVFDENGTIDKYEGDAIIAFWNAPKSFPDHAVRGVRTALRCQTALDALRGVFVEKYGHELHMRIGINTGMALVGNMGSDKRFDYTMLGDSVNLAARLEGANKLFGTYTMISEYTKEAMDGAFPTRELGRLIVKGKTVPVSVFEPYLPEDYASKQDMIAIFNEGLTAYYDGRIGDAESAFEKIHEEDEAADSYLRACKSGPTVDDGWDGVIELTTK